MGTIGIEWVNKYHGRAPDLSNNDNNARGFYNTLNGVRVFEWGNDVAWDRDFEQQGVGFPAAGTDQIWVDDVDITFFSGHGSSSGPFFGVTSWDDGVARSSNMRLGDRQSEWVVFDACEVLRYNGGAVFANWGWPVFHGLHYLLGFHTTCHDSSSRGAKFAARLNQGYSVRQAWIMACKETEGSGTHWAYLRADQNGTDTYNDHWHGKGFVSSDPNNPSVLWHCHGSC